jgi:phosphoenolpyruvate-protein kinase (PTS system EI component)
MSTSELRGVPAAGGVAVGRAHMLHEPEPDAGGAGGEEARTEALAALDAVAAELAERAEALRFEGLVAEAEILDANSLMASDPVLRDEVAALALELPAAAALRSAADRHAALLAALPDPLLAARAADVSELGRRAARRLVPPGPPPRTDGPAIVVARELGPAEVAELRDADAMQVSGIALAEGSATSHAAIMARSLGLPMAVGLGDGLLAVEAGGTLVLDGDRGRLYVDPDEDTEAWGRSTMAWEEDVRRTLAAGRSLPAVTRDGEAVWTRARRAWGCSARSSPSSRRRPGPRKRSICARSRRCWRRFAAGSRPCARSISAPTRRRRSSRARPRAD